MLFVAPIVRNLTCGCWRTGQVSKSLRFFAVFSRKSVTISELGALSNRSY